MLTLKYFETIRQAPLDPSSKFDLSPFRTSGRWHNLKSYIFDRILLAVLCVLRAVWPNPQIGRLLLVTRACDVKQVLKDSEHFTVPFGPEMKRFAGADSVLGMDGPGHARHNEIIRSVLLPADLDNILCTTREFTHTLIAASSGRIDVVRDVITRVSTETCSRYFGLGIDDQDQFAEWSIAMSMLLFADPCGDAMTRQTALAGAANMRHVVHRAISVQRKSPDPLTVLGRLLQRQSDERRAGEEKPLSDEEICGILMSLVTGFVPTNTLAAGKILQELLRRPQQMNEARQLSVNGDREGLKRMLLEAARLNAALSPGQWRYAAREQTIAPGTWRSKRVREGTVLMVSTRSALRDGREIERPWLFQRDRKVDPNLMFGYGPHTCLGEHIATEHIVEIFQVVLAQPNLRRATGNDGRFAWIGPFPERLDMEFGTAKSALEQSMVTICAPLMPDLAKRAEQLIVALREAENAKQPGEANETLREALDKTGIVHFASMSVIDAGSAGKKDPYLLLELNVDGTPETAIPTVAEHTRTHLQGVFDCTTVGGANLTSTFRECSLDLQTRPWGAIGLNFPGTGEFSVADIRRQRELAAFAKKALELFVATHSGVGSRAMPAIRFARDLINQSKRYKEAALGNGAINKRIGKLLEEGAQFQDYIILPGRKRLAISDWVERTPEDAFYRFLRSWDFWKHGIVLVLLAAIMGGGIYHAIRGTTWLGIVGELLVSMTGGIAATGMLVLAIATFFVLYLRYKERTDVSDDRDPELSDIEAIAGRENLAGHAQNHFMAVTQLKSGWFRKLTLALSLWGIKQLVTYAYRPGFVLNMGTIHYARWFRLPGTDKLIFLSNYDGSWESYLEDFIMKAHPGQTAAWSNGVGFPKTSLLVNEGARDGDRFKRWVRRQQVPSQYWYSCFRDLTTSQIRNNAVIHQGLARASSDTAARNWLSCFGSMQRPDRSLETDEIQSLVFRGFKHAHFASYGLVEFPDDANACAAWLSALVPGTNGHGGSEENEACWLTFGDHPFNPHDKTTRNLASFVAFSASGLEKLGLASADSDYGLATFAGVFNIGMHNRERILGDRHDLHRWRWADAERVNGAESHAASDRTGIAHAVVIVYGDSIAECQAVLAEHRKLLGKDFIAVIDSEPLEKDKQPEDRVFREHFGFRDGISQPVIKGTQRFGDGARERDIVEPGEFVLGYRNNLGYYPPAIRVSAETDLEDRLPEVIDGGSPFPSFTADNGEVRDFGRNGSFLVVRQIQQHVEAFDGFTEDTARKIDEDYAHLSHTVGSNITADWVAAKMMGRWRDGEALVLRPTPYRSKPLGPAELPSNDFTYAEDDPRGMRCPFGAHVRRANPRDGLHPDDITQQAIVNRHRLLRRGRPYETAQEKGMMFTCLCGDLERQFEFVQQSWIASSSFHGLSGEIDPIIGWQDPAKTGIFTIPTPAGPVTLPQLDTFVTVRAGGYFFMPSRAAIYYLLDRCKEAARTQKDEITPTPPAPSSAAAHAPGTCTRADAQ
jgi:Dyp-type peroxidase family